MTKKEIKEMKQREELALLSFMHPADMTEKQLKAFEALKAKFN
jgi:hypothetical protein